MPQQERVTPQKSERQTEPVAEATADQAKSDKLKADLDEIMDEIEDALIENAEEFAAGFIQKGGE